MTNLAVLLLGKESKYKEKKAKRKIFEKKYHFFMLYSKERWYFINLRPNMYLVM